MWHSGTWFGGESSCAGLMVGLDLKGLSLPERFHNVVIL